MGCEGVVQRCRLEDLNELMVLLVVFKGRTARMNMTKGTTKRTIKQSAGQRVTWKYGKGTYSGTVIRKTADATYARTKNGLVKKIIHKR